MSGKVWSDFSGFSGMMCLVKCGLMCLEKCGLMCLVKCDRDVSGKVSGKV